MYVVEHALLNLINNKSRNALIGVIIFAIITSTVVALAIFNTTGIVIEETRAALLSAVRITPQRQTVGGAVTAGSGQHAPEITLEQYRSFAESGYIDGADIREGGRGIEATYFLKRPDMLAEFEAELRSMGLPEAYAVRVDDTMFERAAQPVESLRSLSLTFLIIVLVLGAIIMILLSAIAIRERKYEIGVLRAMGMKKKKVALGLWAEIITLTCICFLLGMGAGSLLSQPVSDAIMTGQGQPPAVGSSTLADRLSEATTEQPRGISVSVSSLTTLQIFAVSLFLASVSGTISVRRITKYEPIKILMERT